MNTYITRPKVIEAIQVTEDHMTEIAEIDDYLVEKLVGCYQQFIGDYLVKSDDGFHLMSKKDFEYDYCTEGIDRSCC